MIPKNICTSINVRYLHDCVLIRFPVTRYWDRCSQQCNKGKRQEQNNPSWQLECHAFPCEINEGTATLIFTFKAYTDRHTLYQFTNN